MRPLFRSLVSRSYSLQRKSVSAKLHCAASVTNRHGA